MNDNSAREISGTGAPAAGLDMGIVLAATLASAILCWRWNVSEVLRRWSAPWERFQLDELPAVLMVLAVGLAWFAFRRSRESSRELTRRQQAEARLKAALADNRRLAQQYVLNQEAERKDLARELHDELGQYLNVIKLDAVGLRDDESLERTGIAGRARGIVDNCNHIHSSLTGLLRRLRPVGLDELGLAAALEHCVDLWRARLPACEVHLSLADNLGELPEAHAITVYRLVQEALNNVAKHAAAKRATIRVERQLQGDGEFISIAILDDGVGTDLIAPTTGLGLVGMRERIAALQGHLDLTSEPDEGFHVMARIPLDDVVA